VCQTLKSGYVREVRSVTAAIDGHRGPWTEEAFLALGETRDRIELFDGSLIVTPAPDVPHQQIARRIANRLENAADSDIEVVEGINIRLKTGRIFIPDVVVAIDPELVTPAERVLLVTEVVSPGNAGNDRVLKFELYARAGIPWYLLAELNGSSLSLALYRLDHGRYVEHAVAKSGESLILRQPMTVELDPAALLHRRPR
jgi:Uma2 family endonuclease